MPANLTWDHDSDWALLKAHGGWEFGQTLDEALPKLRAKKRHEAAFTIQALGLRDNDIVGEIGPGFGFEAAEIAPRVTHLHLFDISQSFQNFCRKNVQAPNVSFHLIKPNELEPLKEKKINKIYSAGVFIHLNTYDLFHYLKNISEALPAKGRLLFNYRNISARDATRHDDWETSMKMYLKDKLNLFGLMYWHSPQTIEIMCREVGLNIDAIHYPDRDYTYVICSKP